ncbi:hypothetical protein D2E23_0365 [Bifidobacterium callimiconis]|uniref:Uncharacterized protein n=1 Tax=Bifidobacterium callimiconis TaxID=2306973 RepID=A0A430FIK2_9BIFI|nr:hypothetical protein D2E23_0365 [Bifidobacterium callimiconis]
MCPDRGGKEARMGEPSEENLASGSSRADSTPDVTEPLEVMHSGDGE